MPAEGSESLPSDSTTTTSAAAGGSGDSSGNVSPDTSASGNKGLSGGVIAGIVIAAVCFVAVLVILFFVLGRNRVYSQWMSSQDGRTERTARWAMGNSFGAPKSEVESNTTKPSGTDVKSVGMPDATNQCYPAPGSMSGDAGSGTYQHPNSWNWNGQPASVYVQGISELEGAEMAHHLPNRRLWSLRSP